MFVFRLCFLGRLSSLLIFWSVGCVVLSLFLWFVFIFAFFLSALFCFLLWFLWLVCF